MQKTQILKSGFNKNVYLVVYLLKINHFLIIVFFKVLPSLKVMTIK